MSTPSLNPPTSSDGPTKVIVYTDHARFPLGKIVATPAALVLLEETHVSAAELLQKHVTGDWGDLCTDDAEANEFAVNRSLRIFSVYRLGSADRSEARAKMGMSNQKTLWIITEADRSSTCLLTPRCY